MNSLFLQTTQQHVKNITQSDVLVKKTRENHFEIPVKIIKTTLSPTCRIPHPADKKQTWVFGVSSKTSISQIISKSLRKEKPSIFKCPASVGCVKTVSERIGIGNRINRAGR
jgi:hypothetical protein